MPAIPDMLTRLAAALSAQYRLDRELGEGGMATVYLADDLKHDRKVAIKVLKPELAAVVGGARFVGEIKTTANLQHPHILPLFDSGEADGFLFFVMPYVEGETLRARIDRDGQLPTDEALALATKIGAALSAAHAQGIVHRDIKPANILLANGEPLVADFGIALAVDAGGGQRLTETGLSVGTPYYMSPEQATGEPNVGPAADQYALGAVLYEMLVGDPPFVGSSAQAVLGKIIQGAPARPRDGRRSIPANVDGAVMKALERLPADRFGSVREMLDALTTASFRYGEEDAAGGGRSSNLLALGLATMTLLFAAVAGWALTQKPPAPAPSTWYIGFSEGAAPAARDADGRNALSPDGSRLVYVGEPSGAASPSARTQLWLREAGRLEATAIPGTDDAMDPAFAPDGERLAFVVLGAGVRELRAGPLDGGPFRLLTDSVVDAGGVSWGEDGYIYYDANFEGDGFARISEAGGRPEFVTTPRGNETWHAQPHVLPQGAGVLFHAAGVDSIGVVDPSSGEHRHLVSGVAGVYAASGHLVWAQADGTMLAAPLDLSTLELAGAARPLAEGVALGPFGGWNGAISREGTFVYTVGTRSARLSRLVRVGPEGVSEPVDEGWQGDFGALDVAPNSGQLAVEIVDSNGREQIWVRDRDRGPARQLTSDGRSGHPKWAPDGERLFYLASRDSVFDLVLRDPSTTGRGEVLLAGALQPGGFGMVEAPEAGGFGFDVAASGDWLVVAEMAGPYAQRLGPDLRPVGDRIPLDLPAPARAGRARMMFPELSPDGRWVTYFVDQAGIPTVTVRPFPNVSDGAWSLDAPAVLPRWSSDGRYLYFIALPNAEVLRVPVSTEGVFATGEPERVARLNGWWNQQRFVIDAAGEVTATEAVGTADRTVRVEGFFAELEQLFGGEAR